MDNKEQFLKECRNKAFNSNQLEIIQSAIDYGIEPDKARILAKIQYDEHQMEQLLRALKEEISPEIMNLLISKNNNHYIMEEIINGAIEGLTLEEITAYALSDDSPHEMKRKRQERMEQKKEQESDDLTVWMNVLKTEFEAVKNGLHMMEDQSERIKTMIISQKEEELNEVRQLVEAKELVIKNLQTLNRERQEQIIQLGKKMEEKEQTIQDLLKEKNKDMTDSGKEETVKEPAQNINEKHLFRYTGGAAMSEGTKNNKYLSKIKKLFSFHKKRPDLMRKILEKDLSAEQTKEIRLGIKDGLSEEQLIMMAEASLSPDRLAEIRNTMKQLNERRGEAKKYD